MDIRKLNDELLKKVNDAENAINTSMHTISDLRASILNGQAALEVYTHALSLLPVPKGKEQPSPAYAYLQKRLEEQKIGLTNLNRELNMHEGNLIPHREIISSFKDVLNRLKQ